MTNDYSNIPRGNEYELLLSVRTPSRGRVSRVWGNKTGRQHVLLSDLERNYFAIAEYSDYVEDIREQFPMSLEQTESIAVELGISHPSDPKTKKHIVMTSDFCLSQNKNGVQQDIVRTVKPADELLKERIIEKFEIEREYWRRQGIDWGIVTDKEINKTIADNIWRFRDCYSLENDEFGGKLIYQPAYLGYVQSFIRIILNETKSTSNNITMYEANMGLQPGWQCLYKNTVGDKNA